MAALRPIAALRPLPPYRYTAITAPYPCYTALPGTMVVHAATVVYPAYGGPRGLYGLQASLEASL